MRYWILEEGQVKGPFSEHELGSLPGFGGETPVAEVLPDGGRGPWMKAAENPALGGLFGTAAQAWWVHVEGRILGPYDKEGLWALPGFDLNAVVCPAGLPGRPGDWMRAESCPELLAGRPASNEVSPEFMAAEAAYGDFFSPTGSISKKFGIMAHALQETASGGLERVELRMNVLCNALLQIMAKAEPVQTEDPDRGPAVATLAEARDQAQAIEQSEDFIEEEFLRRLIARGRQMAQMRQQIFALERQISRLPVRVSAQSEASIIRTKREILQQFDALKRQVSSLPEEIRKRVAEAVSESQAAPAGRARETQQLLEGLPLRLETWLAEVQRRLNDLPLQLEKKLAANLKSNASAAVPDSKAAEVAASEGFGGLSSGDLGDGLGAGLSGGLEAGLGAGLGAGLSAGIEGGLEGFGALGNPPMAVADEPAPAPPAPPTPEMLKLLERPAPQEPPPPALQLKLTPPGWVLTASQPAAGPPSSAEPPAAAEPEPGLADHADLPAAEPPVEVPLDAPQPEKAAAPAPSVPAPSANGRSRTRWLVMGLATGAALGAVGIWLQDRRSIPPAQPPPLSNAVTPQPPETDQAVALARKHAIPASGQALGPVLESTLGAPQADVSRRWSGRKEPDGSCVVEFSTDRLDPLTGTTLVYRFSVDLEKGSVRGLNLPGESILRGP